MLEFLRKEYLLQGKTVRWTWEQFYLYLEQQEKFESYVDFIGASWGHMEYIYKFQIRDCIWE